MLWLTLLAMSVNRALGFKVRDLSMMLPSSRCLLLSPRGVVKYTETLHCLCELLAV